MYGSRTLSALATLGAVNSPVPAHSTTFCRKSTSFASQWVGIDVAPPSVRDACVRVAWHGIVSWVCRGCVWLLFWFFSAFWSNLFDLWSCYVLFLLQSYISVTAFATGPWPPSNNSANVKKLMDLPIIFLMLMGHNNKPKNPLSRDLNMLH